MNKIRLTSVRYFKSWLIVQKDLLVLASFFFFLNRILVVLGLLLAERICLFEVKTSVANTRLLSARQYCAK